MVVLLIMLSAKGSHRVTLRVLIVQVQPVLEVLEAMQVNSPAVVEFQRRGFANASVSTAKPRASTWQLQITPADLASVDLSSLLLVSRRSRSFGMRTRAVALYQHAVCLGWVPDPVAVDAAVAMASTIDDLGTAANILCHAMEEGVSVTPRVVKQMYQELVGAGLFKVSQPPLCCAASTSLSN